MSIPTPTKTTIFTSLYHIADSKNKEVINKTLTNVNKFKKG